MADFYQQILLNSGYLPGRALFRLAEALADTAMSS